MQEQNTNQQADQGFNQAAPEAVAQNNNKLMSVLAYIGPLVIVSYLTSKNDATVKFHIKQGLVLFIIEVAVWILGMTLFMLWPFLQIVNLAVLILSIVGIINAVGGKEKMLPLVGQFSKHFKF